jgi:predicted nucleic acid-binding protein
MKPIPDGKSRVPLVLDTNVVLDLWVFADPTAQPLRAALAVDGLDWMATAAMREELERVLMYGAIQSRLAGGGMAAAGVLARFDAAARIVDAPAAAPVRCSDPHDQKFIDLAVGHKCLLLSKDRAVLRLAKKLAALQVSVVSALPPVSSYSLNGA